MSFPGTYNISYYYGDTLEFRVFPKNSSGEPFNLSTFSNPKFTIARNRNTPVEDHISCFAQIDSDQTSILCAIRPEDAEELIANNDGTFPTYVYDIEISKSDNTMLYPIVYTLLNGSVSISRDVTRPGSGGPDAQISIPLNPTNLVLTSSTTSTLSVSWTAPTTGDAPTLYKLAVIPFTENLTDIRQALQDSNLSTASTTFTFTGLEADTDYSVVVRSTNSAGDASIDTILFNTVPFTTSEIPATVPSAPTINSIEAADSSLVVNFTAGADGGSSITNYKYSIDGINYIAFDPAKITSPVTITGLTNGTAYPVTILAVNSVGDSLPSNSITQTPVAPEPEPEPEPEPDFVVTSSGTSAYIINGVSNDTITLVRGETYIFDINASGHPFWIQTSSGAYNSANVYNVGITGNGTQVGTITWVVDATAPNTLYYVCQFHSAMQGTINIIDPDPQGYDS
jgi:hypothetical protein